MRDSALERIPQIALWPLLVVVAVAVAVAVVEARAAPWQAEA